MNNVASQLGEEEDRVARRLEMDIALAYATTDPDAHKRAATRYSLYSDARLEGFSEVEALERADIQTR